MFFKKIWKKITNKKEYQYLKSIESNKKSNEEFKVKFEPYINNIQKKIKSQKELSILHSGHSGDIINALPVIKELSKTNRDETEKSKSIKETGLNEKDSGSEVWCWL